MKQRSKTAVILFCMTGAVIWAVPYISGIPRDDTEQAQNLQTSISNLEPNIIVFLTDTVRADRMEAYGHAAKTAPFFAEFSERHFLFERAYAPSPWTRPSVASLFTSLYPQRHNVQFRQDSLAKKFPTLAEMLRSQGWNTYILNTNPHITKTWQMTRGFEHEIHVMPDPDEFKAGNDASIILEHLQELAPKLEPPFFLYVHLIDPHYPYEPPGADLRALKYAPKGAPSSIRYEGEIHFTDRHIRTMMETLQEYGHLEHAVTWLTSDHGDEFKDHGNIGHGKTLYEEVVHIPMALGLHGPIKDSIWNTETNICHTVESPVSLVDIMPTLIDLLHLDAPSYVEGISLLPHMTCNAKTMDRPLFFSVEKERASLAGVLSGHSKLIVNRSTGRSELFFLDEDPKEKNGSIQSRKKQEVAESLRTLLNTYEWQSRAGIHLELASEDGIQDETSWEIRLATQGAFESIEQHASEASDGYEISPNRRTATIRSTVRSTLHRSPKHIWAHDRDHFTIAVNPPNAPIEIYVNKNGRPASFRDLIYPTIKQRAWPLQVTAQDLNEPATLFDRRPAGLYLYASPENNAPKTELEESEVHDALRSLGYIQ